MRQFRVCQNNRALGLVLAMLHDGNAGASLEGLNSKPQMLKGSGLQIWSQAYCSYLP